MVAILGVAVQTMLVKQLFIETLKNKQENVQWLDTMAAGIYLAFWLIPHILLVIFRHRVRFHIIRNARI